MERKQLISSVYSGEIIFKLTLPNRPMNWNKYIGLERANKQAAARVKRDEKESIIELCHGYRYDGGYPVRVVVMPHFADMRSDLDNVRVKGIIDGLVSAGVICNDNLRCIQEIVITPVFDKVEGLELIIEPVALDG